jgi:hypothetical protein
MSDTGPSPPPDPDPERRPSVDDGVRHPREPEADPAAADPLAGERPDGTTAPGRTPPAETSATRGLAEDQPPVWLTGSRVAVVVIVVLTLLAAGMFLVMALVLR